MPRRAWGAAERPQDARGGGAPYRPAVEHLDEKQSGEGWREALSAEQRAALPHGMQLHPPSAAIDLTIGKNAADETAPLVYDVLLEFFFAEGTPKKLAMRVPNPRKADEVKVSLSAVPCARTVRVTSTPCSMSGGKLGCEFEPSVNEQPLPACAEPSDAFLKEKGGTKTAPHFWNTTAAAQAARTQAAAASAAAARAPRPPPSRRPPPRRGAPPRAAAAQRLDAARAAARRARRLLALRRRRRRGLRAPPCARVAPADRRRLGGRGRRPRRRRGREVSPVRTRPAPDPAHLPVPGTPDRATRKCVPGLVPFPPPSTPPPPTTDHSPPEPGRQTEIKKKNCSHHTTRPLVERDGGKSAKLQQLAVRAHARHFPTGSRFHAEVSPHSSRRQECKPRGAKSKAAQAAWAERAWRSARHGAGALVRGAWRPPGGRVGRADRRRLLPVPGARPARLQLAVLAPPVLGGGPRRCGLVRADDRAERLVPDGRDRRLRQAGRAGAARAATRGRLRARARPRRVDAAHAGDGRPGRAVARRAGRRRVAALARLRHPGQRHAARQDARRVRAAEAGAVRGVGAPLPARAPRHLRAVGAAAARAARRGRGDPRGHQRGRARASKRGTLRAGARPARPARPPAPTARTARAPGRRPAVALP